MLYRYLLLVIACAAILVGIQIPNFVDQYEKRLDAHLIEVSENLRGFQEIADRHHGGSFEALLREHETSTVVTFREEAKPLRAMYERRQAFLREQQALATGLAGQTLHIFLNGHPELVRETQHNYSYNVPLTLDAVTTGAIFAAAVVVLAELLAWLLMLPLRWRRRQRRLGQFN